jgi:hypothetical protein
MNERISLRARHRRRAAIVPIAALCVGLLLSCVGGPHVVIPEGCTVTQAELQGTWAIRHAVATLTCPAGTKFATTATTDRFSPVTVVRDETVPGFRITAAGLTATVADVTCDIQWTYLDHDTNARYECFSTFQPDSRTAGGATEAGHADRVTLSNKAGSSCSIPPPYLDSYIVIEGS